MTTIGDTVVFAVEGSPIAKERARRGRGGWYTPAKTKSYEEKVGWSAIRAGVQPLAGPVSLSIRLWFPDKRKRDVDNVAKALMDALNRIAWHDDGQVVELHVTRHLDPERPRAEIEIKSVSSRLDNGGWKDVRID